MRTIGVRLRLLVGDYKQEAREAGKATDELGEKITKAGKKSQADLDKVALAAAGAGAALLAAAGIAVVAGARFDKQMSEVGAVSGAAADEMDRLRQAALDAGEATVFSATEAAQAEAELAKAGISTADILAGALSGSLDLASAGSLGLADSATIAASAMNTFGLKGSDVAHVADVLAAASNKSAASVQDLGLGLQQVGLVAAQNNLTLEDTVGVLSALADRGLRGSDAGTSLKTALQRLSAPQTEAKKQMDSLGISMYDAAGNMVDVATVAGQLQNALKDLSPAQRNAALQTIFGSDAIRAGNVLYQEGEQGIRAYIAAVDDEGAASDVAAKKLDNLAGDIEELTGSLETLFIGASGGASSGLRVLTQGATGLVNALGNLPGPLQQALVILAGTGGVSLLAAAGWLKMRGTISDVVTELSAVGPGGARAARGIQSATMWATRGALAVGALATASVILGSVLHKDLNPEIERLAKDLAVFGSTGKLDGEALRIIGSDAGDLGRALAENNNLLSKFGVAMADLVLGDAGPSNENAEKVAAYDAGLAQLVRSGGQDEAAAAFKRMWAEAQTLDVSLEQLQAKFPAYIAANLEATQASQRLANSTENLAREQLTAVDAGQKLAEVWAGLNGAAKSADEEMLDAVEAAEAIEEAFKDSKGALEGNTEAALNSRIAMRDAALQAYEAADAYLTNGGSAEGAKQILDDFRKANEDAAVAAGGARDRVKEFNDALYRLPPSKRVVLELVTRATISETIRENARAVNLRRWGGVTEYAQAGLLRDAEVFPAGSSPLYAFAEPATRGEAFVPRSGDYGRSMGILSHAAGWYGARVVPGGGHYGGGAGAGGEVVNVHVQLIDPQTGAVTRKAMIADATNRNVASQAIRDAFP